jgi:hypothetical protein
MGHFHVCDDSSAPCDDPQDQMVVANVTEIDITRHLDLLKNSHIILSQQSSTYSSQQPAFRAFQDNEGVVRIQNSAMMTVVSVNLDTFRLVAPYLGDRDSILKVLECIPHRIIRTVL